MIFSLSLSLSVIRLKFFDPCTVENVRFNCVVVVAVVLYNTFIYYIYCR